MPESVDHWLVVMRQSSNVLAKHAAAVELIKQLNADDLDRDITDLEWAEIREWTRGERVPIRERLVYLAKYEAVALAIEPRVLFAAVAEIDRLRQQMEEVATEMLTPLMRKALITAYYSDGESHMLNGTTGKALARRGMAEQVDPRKIAGRRTGMSYRPYQLNDLGWKIAEQEALKEAERKQR